MSMTIGVRAHDYGRCPAGALAGRIRAAGWEAAQIAAQKLCGNLTLPQVTPELLGELGEAFHREGVATPVLGYYVQLGLPDREKRLEQVALYCQGLRYSDALGAAMVATETGQFTAEESERPRWFEAVVDSVQRMAEQAEHCRALVAIEPGIDHPLNSPELVGELLRRVDSPRVKVVFDPGNLMRPAYQEPERQRRLWRECFEIFGEELCLVHVKGLTYREDGSRVCTTLEEGAIDYAPIFAFLRERYPEIAVLREEAQPATGERDVAFLRRMVQG